MAKQSPTPKTIYIIAGEESGDQLGGRLMKSLHALSPVPINFLGVGGGTMTAQGLHSIFDMTELSVMGLAEVLPKLRGLYKRRDQVVEHIKAKKPDIIITIDSPGFNHRVADKIRPWCVAQGVRHVHYVCPTVWAWKPNRVHTCKKHFDALLAVLPFEPPYFESVGVPCHYVGHSVVQDFVGYDAEQSAHDFRTQNAIAPHTPIVTVLAGSRKSELSRMLPVYQQAVERFVADNPTVHIVIPTLPHLAKIIQAKTKNWNVPVTITTATGAGKYGAFSASRCAVATSGTVSLELALSGCPTVIAYRMSPLSWVFIKRMLRVPYVSILNIMAGAEIVPELIQDKCTVDALVNTLNHVYNNGQGQLAQLSPHVKQLQGGNPNRTPSDNAGVLILDYLGVPLKS